MSENKEKKRSFLARLFGKDKEANKKQLEDEREKHLRGGFILVLA